MNLKGVFSFALGFGCAAAVALNGPKVRRGLAKAVVQGEKAAASASSHLMRVSAEMAEDFQDALAEARSREESAQAVNSESLLAAIDGLRREIGELRRSAGATVQ